MEKYIVDNRTGLKYELIGEYYLFAGDDEPALEPLDIGGQCHRRFGSISAASMTGCL